MPGGAEIVLAAFLVVLIAGGTTAHAQETGEQEAVRNTGAETADVARGPEDWLLYIQIGHAW